MMIGAAGAIACIACYAIGSWWQDGQTAPICRVGFAVYFRVFEASVPWSPARTARRILRDARAPGTPALLRFVQALPEFGTEVFIAAMGSIDDAGFLCWRRPGAAAEV